MRPFHTGTGVFSAPYGNDLFRKGWKTIRLRAEISPSATVKAVRNHIRSMALQLQKLRFADCNKGIAFMENREVGVEDSSAEDGALTLPHFDDEATVQSARPVVPLHEVRKASRSKRRLILGAALCLSALVGAVAASLVYSNRAQRAQQSATAASPAAAQESAAGFTTPSGEVSGAIVNPDEAVAVDTEAATATPSDDRPEVQNSTRASRQPVKNTRVPHPVESVVSQPEPQDREATEEEIRREERREARRLRRERRINERRAGDGLTRIREIFEGSPRP